MNGEVAHGRGFGTGDGRAGDYHGYSNGPSMPGSFAPAMSRFSYLGDADMPFRLPPKCYFALGDNSFHSSDSRDWGGVPEENVMGARGFSFIGSSRRTGV